MGNVTVYLTSSRPVTFNGEEWPLIADAAWDDCNITDPALYSQCIEQGQADRWELRVRQHQDGRVLVYGTYEENILGSERDGLKHAGYLFTPFEGREGSIEHYVETTRHDLDAPAQLAQDCINDLKPQEI